MSAMVEAAPSDNKSAEPSTTTPDESGDAATLSSMAAESNEQQHKEEGGTSFQTLNEHRQTARLVRRIKSFNFTDKEASDKDVAKVVSTDLTAADDKDDKLSAVAAEWNDLFIDHVPVPKLAFKYRVAASLLRRIFPFICRSDGTFDKTLAGYIDFKVKANATPVDGIYSKEVVIDSESDVWARIFAPSVEEDPESGKKLLLPVIVYTHGGGFALDSPSTGDYDKICRKLCKACNAVIVSVNYRMTPEFGYPVQYDDCFKALKWLQSSPSADQLPAIADVSKCFLAGDSAGGNIVHFLGCRAAATDLKPVRILGWIQLQPFFGGVERTKAESTILKPFLLYLDLADWFWKAYLPKGADRDHEACNVFGPNAPDISKLPLPPLLIFIGTNDILKDWQARYAKKMRSIIGKENLTVKIYSGGFHAFFAYNPVLQKKMMGEIGIWVKDVLAASDST